MLSEENHFYLKYSFYRTLFSAAHRGGRTTAPTIATPLHLEGLFLSAVQHYCMYSGEVVCAGILQSQN